MMVVERLLASLLAAALSTGPQPVEGVPEWKPLLDRAEELRAQDDLTGAAHLAVQAYYQLPADRRTGSLGTEIVKVAADDFLNAYIQSLSKDEPLLDEALALLEEHLASVSPDIDESLIDEVKMQRDRVQALREKLQSDPSEPDSDDAEPEPERTPIPGEDDTRFDQRADPLGVGLIAGGGALLLVSAGLFTGGSVVVVHKNRELARDPDADAESRDEFEKQENRKATAWFIGAGVALALGATGVVVGAVRLRNASRDDIVLGPWVGPGSAGLIVRGRFPTRARLARRSPGG